MRLRQVYRTQSNSFGLSRLYDKESLLVHDPEDTLDDIAGSQPLRVRLLTTTAQLSDMENPFYPYPNEASLRLGDWYWNQGALKSKDSFRRLLDIIGSPSFRPDDIQNTKWTSIDHLLGMLTTDEDLEQSTEWLNNDAGWICTTVTISVPFSRRSANPGSKNYSVSDFYHRSLLSIIRERVLDPHDHHLFHYEPYELRWRRPGDNRDTTVHGELFTSRSFLEAHRELLESPPVLGCTLPRRIVALMFWSDATQLTSFGDAKLWPLYVFFGNQTKYRRGQPSAKLCSHIAYFQTASTIPQFQVYISVLITCIYQLPDSFKDFVLENSGENLPSGPFFTHCHRELFHAQWTELLDDEFVNAYEHGSVLTCADGIERQLYPRIFTYSADYPEK